MLISSGENRLLPLLLCFGNIFFWNEEFSFFVKTKNTDVVPSVSSVQAWCGGGRDCEGWMAPSGRPQESTLDLEMCHVGDVLEREEHTLVINDDRVWRCLEAFEEVGYILKPSQHAHASQHLETLVYGE